MHFLNYDELVEHLINQPSQARQLEELIKYFIDNVEYDYVMIEHINEIVTPKFAKYTDSLFPNTSSKFREKAINYMRNSSNMSNAYWSRLRKIYLTPEINIDGSTRQVSMIEALNSMSPEVIEYNGLLRKGTSEHIVQFAKKLCDDVNIPCLIINGISSGKMTHFWLDISADNMELFYDISYAIYTRDNFCCMGKRYSQKDWLGITPKQLYKNQCTRTIITPQGFDLQDLGLNNLPLKMIDIAN